MPHLIKRATDRGGLANTKVPQHPSHQVSGKQYRNPTLRYKLGLGYADSSQLINIILKNTNINDRRRLQVLKRHLPAQSRPIIRRRVAFCVVTAAAARVSHCRGRWQDVVLCIVVAASALSVAASAVTEW